MNKKITMGLILCLMIGIGFGISVTYSTPTETVFSTKDVTLATVGIDLLTSNNGDDIAMPGDVIEEPVAILNDESSDAYVRVKIYRYWADGDDNKSMTTQEDPNYLDPEEIKFELSDDWLVFEGDEYGEVIYAYYTKPLAPGEQALVLEQYSYLDNEVNNNQYADMIAHLNFYADAVQTFAAEDAFLAEWGVNVTFDDNGNIDTLNI